MNLFAVPVDKDNLNILLDYMDNLMENYKDDVNSDWFPRLRYNYDQYLHWTLCFDRDDNKIAGFSCIQSHFFPEDTVRILTRTFYSPGKRNPTIYIKGSTQTGVMASEQMNWLKDKKFKKAIFTLEPKRTPRILNFLASKISKSTGCLFVPQQDKIKTFQSASPEEYQFYAVCNIG